MTPMERAVAWVWNQIPTHHQLWLWARAPRVADFCEELANQRDTERTK